MRLVDLSHTISDGLITYPGLPGPVISDHLTFDASHEVYAEGTEFSIGRIEMVSNTGTYLDTPGHRHRGGHDLSGLALERCALLPALVVEGESTGATGLAAFEGLDVAGHAVLVSTGWDLHFGTEAYAAPEHPYPRHRGRRVAGRPRSRAGRDRLGQHRRHPASRRPAGPHAAARARDPGRRAPHGTLRAAAAPGRRSAPYRPRSPGCRRSPCGPSRPCHETEFRAIAFTWSMFHA